MDKNQSRLRRALQTRKKIGELKVNRLSVHRTNENIYATLFSSDGSKVLASSSTLEAAVKASLAGKTGKGGNQNAAAIVGKSIAEKAVALGISAVAFDRSGFRYHGRIKALADAAREAGLKF